MFDPETSDMTNGDLMIKLTRLSHEPLVLNSDLIEHMEVTPDTVITLTTGQKLRVSETADEVIARVIEFRRAVFERSCQCSRTI
jgi:flagellar protein FlbD